MDCSTRKAARVARRVRDPTKATLNAIQLKETRIEAAIATGDLKLGGRPEAFGEFVAPCLHARVEWAPIEVGMRRVRCAVPAPATTTADCAYAGCR
jgi:hypothetical protein